MSLWKAISARQQNFPELSQEIIVDVAIIGGGITGITAAAELIKKGKKVAILEADQIGGVTTGMSTGNLYVAVQPFYQNIAAKFDFETAKQIAHSRRMAIDYIESNIRHYGIQCQFHRRPWYAYTVDNPRISFDDELRLYQKMEIAVEEVKSMPVPFKFNRAMMMANQARFNPLQYVISMADELAKHGCLIFENTRVINFEEQDFCVVTTRQGKVTAKKILLATHTPIGINATQSFVAPYRSYVVGVRIDGNDYPEGHFWDLDRPPHATCTHAIKSAHPELMLVAGSHHKTGQGGDMVKHYQELEKFLRDHFAVTNVAYRWSAQHYQSADDVPYIGLTSRFAKHTYMATGYFADGLVYGTIAGVIISNLMTAEPESLEAVYQSNRFNPLASAGFLTRENTNVFWQYLKDFPIFTDNDFHDLKRGEGRVVEIDREKFAVSRDEKDKLHMVSAVCTHMKGIVNWNNAEKTWDCPCHGSRFTQEGKVIEGPAIKDLPEKTT